MLDSNPGKRLYFLNTLPAQEVKASPGATLGLRDSERLRLVQRGLMGHSQLGGKDGAQSWLRSRSVCLRSPAADL